MKTNKKSYKWFVMLIALLLSGCGQVVSRNTNGSCKKIVYVIAKGDISDISSICPDGSNLTKLTDSTTFNTNPAWSPDGKSIAFSSSRTGNSQIFVMNANGSDPIQLTFDHQNDLPVWLPDGKQIAFRTTDGKGLWWWRIVNIETLRVTQFTEPTYDFFFQTPAWSPDGQHLAYMSLLEQKQRNDGSSQIHIKSIDGSMDTALTNDIWANINPVWSPDGKKIAFLSERDGKYNLFALYVMTVDGQSVRKLSAPIFSESNKLTWSSDGTEIAIDSDVSIGNIYIINVISGQIRELLKVSNGERAFFPSWQP